MRPRPGSCAAAAACFSAVVVAIFASCPFVLGFEHSSRPLSIESGLNGSRLLNGEVYAGRSAAEDELGLGVATEVLDGNLVKLFEKSLRGPPDGRADDLVDQCRGKARLLVDAAHRHGGPDDLAGGDAAALARQLIAAARAAHALED